MIRPIIVLFLSYCVNLWMCSTYVCFWKVATSLMKKGFPFMSLIEPSWLTRRYKTNWLSVCLAFRLYQLVELAMIPMHVCFLVSSPPSALAPNLSLAGYATSIIFVATKQAFFCHDKRRVLSRQTRVCLFVATKMILVAALALAHNSLRDFYSGIIHRKNLSHYKHLYLFSVAWKSKCVWWLEQITRGLYTYIFTLFLRKKISKPRISPPRPPPPPSLFFLTNRFLMFCALACSFLVWLNVNFCFC